MLRHVLIPLDGSELAEKAIPKAKDIVEVDGRITLVSVVNLPEIDWYTYADLPIPIPREKYETAIQHQMADMEEYLRSARHRLEAGGRKVDCYVSEGDPATVILNEAERLNVDAIVMSTHGRTGLTRWLIGSVTDKVLKASSRPVYIIPNRERGRATVP